MEKSLKSKNAVIPINLTLHSIQLSKVSIEKTNNRSISLSLFPTLAFFLSFALIFSTSLSDAATFYKKSKNGVVSYTNFAPKEKGYKEVFLPDSVLKNRVIKKSSRTKFGKYKYSDRFDDHIDKIAKKYSVDPQLVKAIIKVESNFNPSALSPKGAIGVMQLMPGTARDQGVSNPYDPFENIGGGVKYFKMLMGMFNNNLTLALAGYNAGENAVMKYGYQVPPYPETINYVDKVLYHYDHLKNNDKNGTIKTAKAEQDPASDNIKKLFEIAVNAANENEYKSLPSKKPVMTIKVVKANETRERKNTDSKKSPLIPANIDGKFTIQVAAFQELGEAKEMQKSLKSKTYPAYIQKVDLPDKGTWYRVRVGKFASKNEAKNFGSTIKDSEPEIDSMFVTLNK